jgi:DNA polymerase III alpha subunit (gram-positive type)
MYRERFRPGSAGRLARPWGTPVVYFCLDCEASGPVPPLYNLLSIGIQVVRPEGALHVLGDAFYVELKPIFPGFDPGAMAVAGLDPERLQREGKDPQAALLELKQWVQAQNGAVRDRPVFVGHNAVFDWAYVSYYFEHFGIENPFGYKGIDTKSLAMGALRISWNDTSKERLEALLNLPAQDPSRIHRADYDAKYQALILQALLDRPAQGRAFDARAT